MELKHKLEEWAEETVNVYNPMAKKVKLSYYTQSVLARIDDKPEILILGINPGARGEAKILKGSDLLNGNPCFHNKNNDEILKIMKEVKDPEKNRRGWDIWHKLHKLGIKKNSKNIIDSIDKFVLSNMVFFGTQREGQIPKEIDQDKCAQQTIKLIDILNPNLILLLGVKCKHLFEKTKKVKLIEIDPKNLSYIKMGDNYVFAIKHTARFYSNAKCEEIGRTICYAIEHPDDFEEKFKLIQLMHKIESNWSNQWIDAKGSLVHEYYCKGVDEKYERKNGTISVGLKIDGEGNKYVLSILSYGNHPDKFIAKVQEICEEYKLFKKDSNAQYVADAGTEIGRIVDFFNLLLSKMKEYRETDLPV